MDQEARTRLSLPTFQMVTMTLLRKIPRQGEVSVALARLANKSPIEKALVAEKIDFWDLKTITLRERKTITFRERKTITFSERKTITYRESEHNEWNTCEMLI